MVKLHTHWHILFFIVLFLEILVDVFLLLIVSPPISLSFIVLFFLVLIFFILIVALLAHTLRPTLLATGVADTVFLEAVGFLARTNHSRVFAGFGWERFGLIEYFFGRGIFIVWMNGHVLTSVAFAIIGIALLPYLIAFAI